MKQHLLICVTLLTAMLIPINTAHAGDWLQYQNSPADTYNRPELPAEYDITLVGFGVYDTHPDEYWFSLLFVKPITASLFADGKGSWAGVILDINNDGIDDYSLETSRSPFESNYYMPGRFVDRTTNQPIESTKCSIKTWTNLTTGANWVSFSIKKDCLTLGSTLGVQGYSDHISNDNSEYDSAPDTMWTVNPSGGAITPSGNSSSTTIEGQLPKVNSLGESLVTAPSIQPTDLVTLAAETTKSVVTVLCGSGLGSGWAINSDLSPANISNGYKSYVITNHHVISECTSNRNITLVLSNQTRVSGYVYTWDEANDVAGVLTATLIPPLNWRGATPEQGWWVGVLGSPLGFPGILTSGIVSSVNSNTFLGTTNAAINPGNSGGPVFDRSGRVIGLATAKYVNAENFGIFHGTPLLCLKVIQCTGSSQIWQGAVTATPTPTPTPTTSTTSNTLVISASGKVFDAIDSVQAAIISCHDVIHSVDSMVGKRIETTVFGSQCEALNTKIENTKSEFNSTPLSSPDATATIAKLNGYTSTFNSYITTINGTRESLKKSLTRLTSASESLNAAEIASSTNSDLVSAFESRLKIFPSSFRTAIKAKSAYKKVSQGMTLQRTFNTALQSLNTKFLLIEDEHDLDFFIVSLKAFESRYASFLTVSSNLTGLEILIPDYVCLKAKTSLLLPSTGKCPKGYVKTATSD